MPSFRYDHIKIRFYVIKLTVILVGFAIPAVTWVVASEHLQLSGTDLFWPVFVAAQVMTGMFYVYNRYVDEGFARAYGTGGTWAYLAAHFSVDSRPSDLEASETWSGPSQLERKDIVLDTEAGISSMGIYINIHAMGRILLPWASISVLKKHRIAKDGSWQQMIFIGLDGTDLDLNIPWRNSSDELVPQSIGVS